MNKIQQTKRGWVVLNDEGQPVAGPFTTEEAAFQHRLFLEYTGQASVHNREATGQIGGQLAPLAFSPVAPNAAAAPVAKPVVPSAPQAPPVDLDALHKAALARADAVPGLLEQTGYLQQPHGAEPVAMMSRPAPSGLNFAIPSSALMQPEDNGLPPPHQAPRQFREAYNAQRDEAPEAFDAKFIVDQLAGQPKAQEPPSKSIRERHPEAGPIEYYGEDDQRGLRGPLGPIGYERSEQDQGPSPAEKRAKVEEAMAASGRGYGAETPAETQAINSQLASSPFHSRAGWQEFWGELGRAKSLKDLE